MLDTKIQSEEYKFYFLFFLALTFLFSMLMPFSFGDLGIWIAEGRQIFAQGTVYIQDVHSYNMTRSTPYPWLTSVVYWVLDNNFSVELIFFLHRLIPVAIVAFWLNRSPQLLYKTNWFPLVVSISGLSMLIVDRPALLVLLFVPMAFDAVESDWPFKNRFKTLMLLILWTNLHGSFLLFLILLAYRIGMNLIFEWKKSNFTLQITFFLMCVLATFVNPWGVNIYSYVLQTSEISKVRMTEWKPLSFYTYTGEISYSTLLFIFSLLMLLVFAYRKKHFKTIFSSTIILFIISSFMAIRNLPLFFSVMPLFWGKNFADVKDVSGIATRTNLKKLIINRSITLALIAIGIFLFSEYSENIRKDLPQTYTKRYDPTSSFRIGNYLNHFSGKKIFNSWPIGSYLVYSQPNQIFIDTRNIIYSDAVFNDYMNTQANTNGQAEEFLAQHQIDYAVSETTSPLSQTLKTSQNWTFIMEDEGYALFERK